MGRDKILYKECSIQPGGGGKYYTVPLTPMAIEQRAARSQYSLTEYFVRGLVKLQSATVWYSSMDFWKSPRSAESSAACW